MQSSFTSEYEPRSSSGHWGTASSGQELRPQNFRDSGVVEYPPVTIAESGVQRTWGPQSGSHSRQSPFWFSSSLPCIFSPPALPSFTKSLGADQYVTFHSLLTWVTLAYLSSRALCSSPASCGQHGSQTHAHRVPGSWEGTPASFSKPPLSSPLSPPLLLEDICPPLMSISSFSPLFHPWTWTIYPFPRTVIEWEEGRLWCRQVWVWIRAPPLVEYHWTGYITSQPQFLYI